MAEKLSADGAMSSVETDTSNFNLQTQTQTQTPQRFSLAEQQIVYFYQVSSEEVVCIFKEYIIVMNEWLLSRL